MLQSSAGLMDFVWNSELTTKVASKLKAKKLFLSPAGKRNRNKAIKNFTAPFFVKVDPGQEILNPFKKDPGSKFRGSGFISGFWRRLDFANHDKKFASCLFFAAADIFLLLSTKW